MAVLQGDKIEVVAHSYSVASDQLKILVASANRNIKLHKLNAKSK